MRRDGVDAIPRMRAEGSSEAIHIFAERGVGYLQKPFTVIELTAELRRVIDEMK